MTREEFQLMIDASQLSSEQKQLWGDVMLTLDDASLAVFTDVIAHDPEALQLLTENIEMKKKAFQSADKDLFARILQKEKAQVE